MLKLLLAAALAVVSIPANAHQMPCGPTAMIMQNITELGEVPVSAGDVPGGFPIVTYVNPENGDWAIVAHFPDGTSCSMASGGGFRKATGDDIPGKSA